MKRIEKISLLLGLGGCFLFLSGVVSAAPPSKSSSDGEYVYIIGVDDSVQVNVWKNSELSMVVPVRPDGKISIPLIGDVVAAGKTPMQLAADIKEKLTFFIRESPPVTIVMTGLNSSEYVSRVRVTGAVGSPITIPHRKGMTVLDLILVSGGPTIYASGNKTKLYRPIKGGSIKTLKIRLDDILKKGKLETNYAIQPGDILTVPERLF